LAGLVAAAWLLVGPPAPAEEKIQLNVWGMTTSEGRFGWYALIDEFEKRHPNVEVIYGPADRGEDLQKLLCGVVGNSPPDVFRREAMLFGDIAARDILRPLDDFIEADKARPDGLHEEDHIPGVWESGRFEGKMYAIIENSNPLLMAYNRALFREVGLDPDRPPRTWTEWLDATKRLTKRDAHGNITRLGCVFHNTRDDLSFYIRQQGKDAFSEDGTQCNLDSPEGVRAAEFLNALYEANGGRGAYDRFSAMAIPNDRYDPFGSGDVAMVIEDDWVIYRARKIDPDFEIGICPVPAPDGFDPITVSSTHPLLMIPVNARHPKEAWDFIRFVMSVDGQMAMNDANAEYGLRKHGQPMYPGFRPGYAAQDAVAAKYAPREPIFRKAYDDAERVMQLMVPPPISPISAVLRDEARRVVNDVSYGRATPRQSLGAASARLEHQLGLLTARDRLPFLRWELVWLALAAVVAAVVGTVWWRSRGERATSRMQRQENWAGLIFIAPWIVGFLVFTAGPMVFSIAISFSDYDVIHPARFVGLRNYTALVTDDPLFWKSLGNTAYMALALPVGMAAGLGLALLLNTKIKGVGVYRTIYYLPAITPMVAAAVLWYALLNPDGLINQGIESMLGRFGIRGPGWLQDPAWTKPAVVLMGLWGAGGGMILWLAGLQGIPQQLYEAAEIDGAGRLRRFWNVTLPMLTPYIFFSLIVGVIGVFQIFAQALVLTQSGAAGASASGGPADSLLFYVYYLFNNAFRYFKMGYASAQAWILFLIVLVLTAVQWRLSKKWVHYE